MQVRETPRDRPVLESEPIVHLTGATPRRREIDERALLRRAQLREAHRRESLEVQLTGLRLWRAVARTGAIGIGIGHVGRTSVACQPRLQLARKSSNSVALSMSTPASEAVLAHVDGYELGRP